MNAVEALALQAYAGRHIDELSLQGGLPEALPLGEVAGTLGADPEVFVRWFLGEPPQEAFWCPAAVEGFDRVKIWFREGVVVKLAGEWPDLAPDAVKVLGAPEMRLDYQLDVLIVPGGEQVWASRGIALRLNKSGSLPVALSTFVPTTPDEYRRTLQEVAEYREAPAPGEGEFP